MIEHRLEIGDARGDRGVAVEPAGFSAAAEVEAREGQAGRAAARDSAAGTCRCPWRRPCRDMRRRMGSACGWADGARRPPRRRPTVTLKRSAVTPRRGRRAGRCSAESRYIVSSTGRRLILATSSATRAGEPGPGGHALELAPVLPRPVALDQQRVERHRLDQLAVALAVYDFGRDRDEVARLHDGARHLGRRLVPVEDGALDPAGLERLERAGGGAVRRVQRDRQVEARGEPEQPVEALAARAP